MSNLYWTDQDRLTIPFCPQSQPFCIDMTLYSSTPYKHSWLERPNCVPLDPFHHWLRGFLGPVNWPRLSERPVTTLPYSYIFLLLWASSTFPFSMVSVLVSFSWSCSPVQGMWSVSRQGLQSACLEIRRLELWMGEEFKISRIEDCRYQLHVKCFDNVNKGVFNTDSMIYN